MQPRLTSGASHIEHADRLRERRAAYTRGAGKTSLSSNNLAMKLQEYQGYFVDYRLKQFRYIVPFPEVIEFVEFDSEKGSALLAEMLDEGLVPQKELPALRT